MSFKLFFLHETSATEMYTLSLHDALPILKPSSNERTAVFSSLRLSPMSASLSRASSRARRAASRSLRSEEHTSELQSRQYLVCRLLLEKKKYELEVVIAHENYVPCSGAAL